MGSVACSLGLSCRDLCLCWTSDLGHEFVVVYPVSWVSLLIEHTELLHYLLALNLSLKKNLNLNEWLPLVPYLTYYVVQGCQVAAFCNIGKHFIFAHKLINLLCGLHLEDFINEEWITLPSDVHENTHGVIHQVDVITANIGSLENFQRRVFRIIQISIANRNNLWAEKRKQLLWAHLHCLEPREYQLVNCIGLVHYLWNANDL